jgi:hypothetical protein
MVLSPYKVYTLRLLISNLFPVHVRIATKLLGKLIKYFLLVRNGQQEVTGGKAALQLIR